MAPELADPLGALQQQGHLQKGLNTDGDLAFAFLDPKLTGGDPEKSLRLRLPGERLQGVRRQLQGPEGRRRRRHEGLAAGRGEDVYLAQWGNFAAVSPAKAVLAKKPTGVKLQGAIAKEADAKDLIVYANMNAIRPLVLPQVKNGRQELMKQVDDGLNMAGDMGKKFAPVVRLVNQIVNVAEGYLNDATGETLGLGLSDAGVTATLLTDFKPDSYAGKTIAQQKNTNQPLAVGLPDRKFFMFGGSVQDPKLAAKVLGDFLDPITKELANVPEGKAIANAVDAIEEDDGRHHRQQLRMIAPTGARVRSVIQQVVVIQGDAPAIHAGERQMMQATADIMKLIPQQQGIDRVVRDEARRKNVAGVTLDSYETKINGDENSPEVAQFKQIMAMVYGPFGQRGSWGRSTRRRVIMVQGGNDQLVSDAVGSAKANAGPARPPPRT